ncbi:MAG: tetratricopeptide repeat protein [Desulfobulbaceae bacterium]|jgi:tetratricopeptide (TPR) repeat protein|nr:tetratricopeptide repeat protein [Desulfobulbaceae bacterium]MDY0352360.1 tetratricopeptide repeat protein [Desulfobulbaceae bacterium]
MQNTARQSEERESARVVGHIQLEQNAGQTVREPMPSKQPAGDDFFAALADPFLGTDRLQRELERVLAELEELQVGNRWDDSIALFHPVTEKLPELVEAGLEGPVRLKLGFALCRARRHEEAIACIREVVRRENDHFMANYCLAYTVLDLLFTARTDRKPLSAGRRAELIRLAHDHFGRCRELNPDSVTVFYREAILYKEIEGKPRQAVPLFEQAAANWEQLSPEEQTSRHQQRPKYIKSLYHLASCLLHLDLPRRSLKILEKVMELDGDRNHMHPLFKHFAMGKVLFALGRPKEATDHLETAAHRADNGQATDFVWELAARCALDLGLPDRAAAFIGRIPPPARRPYVRWTESDVLVAQGRKDEAIRILVQTAERDRRGRHKALLRLARIHLAAGEAEKALTLAKQAADFCRETFGNEAHEALFWQAACLYRLDRFPEALSIVRELEETNFRYPHFSRLATLVKDAVAGRTTGTRDRSAFTLVK